MASNICGYKECRLCPRACGADRTNGRTGFCRMGDTPVVNLYKLHFGEEPCISGTRGSGTVFFEGCSLGCVFCQNHVISHGATGKGQMCSAADLASIYLELQDMGAHNINLVTPMHFAPTVAESILGAKDMGLRVPVALNVSGYEKAETVGLFEGAADIFLTDFKFWSEDLAGTVCGIRDYRKVAQDALDRMAEIAGSPVFDGDGMLVSGVIVRHLMLPGHLFDTKKILDLLTDRYGDRIVISLMNQYTPTAPAIGLVKQNKLPAEFAGRLNPEHYKAMCDYLALAGPPVCYMQDGDASGDNWIPEFRV